MSVVSALVYELAPRWSSFMYFVKILLIAVILLPAGLYYGTLSISAFNEPPGTKLAN